MEYKKIKINGARQISIDAPKKKRAEKIDFFAESQTMTNDSFSLPFAGHGSVWAWIIYWCNTGPTAVSKSVLVWQAKALLPVRMGTKHFSPKYWHKSPAEAENRRIHISFHFFLHKCSWNEDKFIKGRREEGDVQIYLKPLFKLLFYDTSDDSIYREVLKFSFYRNI